jgi:tyrosinase
VPQQFNWPHLLESKTNIPYQQIDGFEIPREAMPDLKVSVVSSEVKPATSSDELSQWVNGFTLHTEVTDGRPAGLCDGDEY